MLIRNTKYCIMWKLSPVPIFVHKTFSEHTYWEGLFSEETLGLQKAYTPYEGKNIILDKVLAFFMENLQKEGTYVWKARKMNQTKYSKASKATDSMIKFL